MGPQLNIYLLISIVFTMLVIYDVCFLQPWEIYPAVHFCDFGEKMIRLVGVMYINWHGQDLQCAPNVLVPVTLTVYRSNSNFDQNLQCSGLKYALPIGAKFCTCHDSVTMVTCVKFRCDLPNLIWRRSLQNFIESPIPSKYHLCVFELCHR